MGNETDYTPFIIVGILFLTLLVGGSMGAANFDREEKKKKEEAERKRIRDSLLMTPAEEDSRSLI